MGWRPWLLILAVVAVVVCGVGADACPDNICYATADGAGDCTEADPCSLDTSLSIVEDGGTVAVMGSITVASTVVLTADSMVLEGFFDEQEEASLTCAVAGGPCVLVQGAGVTIQGLVLEGSCEGTCISIEAESDSTSHTLELVAFQEITVSPLDDIASLVRLAGTEDIVLYRSMVQECSLSGVSTGVLMKVEGAESAAIHIENVFVYGKLDPNHDSPLLSSASSVINSGSLSLLEFSVHGLDLGSMSLLNGLEGSQVFLSNGTVNGVHAHGVITMDLAEHGRFMGHELEFMNCAFSSSMHFAGSSTHPGDVYLDEVAMIHNTGRMLEATEVNVIISSLTARENADFSLVMAGSVSITNSVVSYNSNEDGPMLQVTGIDSSAFRMPTPTDMIYISSCDFASNTNCALSVATTDGIDPRSAGILLTTCTFLDNSSLGEASAITLDLGSSSVLAQLMYIGISDNSAAEGGAALVCSDPGSDGTTSVDLVLATFANNAPADIAGECSFNCSGNDGPIECPFTESLQSTTSSSTIVLFVFAFVLVAIPATIGACVAQRYITARRNKAMEDNLAASDNLFELEEYPHND